MEPVLPLDKHAQYRIRHRLGQSNNTLLADGGVSFLAFGPTVDEHELFVTGITLFQECPSTSSLPECPIKAVTASQAGIYINSFSTDTIENLNDFASISWDYDVLSLTTSRSEALTFTLNNAGQVITNGLPLFVTPSAYSTISINTVPQGQDEGSYNVAALSCSFDTSSVLSCSPQGGGSSNLFLTGGDGADGGLFFVGFGPASNENEFNTGTEFVRDC
jgi:hypothetical protein